MKILNTFTQAQIESAQKELCVFVRAMAEDCQAKGWSFTATDKAPESFKELKSTTVEKHLLIANYDCESSIYGENDVNVLFRFWHDVSHLEVDQGFSLKGETAAISKQLEQAREFGISDLAYMMFYYDTIGQVEYYFRHKAFLKDQKSFVLDCVKYGLKYAILIKN